MRDLGKFHTSREGIGSLLKDKGQGLPEMLRDKEKIRDYMEAGNNLKQVEIVHIEMREAKKDMETKKLESSKTIME